MLGQSLRWYEILGLLQIKYVHVPGNEGLNIPEDPLLYEPVVGLMHSPLLPPTPKSPDE